MGRRLLTAQDVIEDGLDGRKRTWLVGEMARDYGLKISASAISNYLKGIRTPTQETLQIIQSILSSEKTAQRKRERKRLRHQQNITPKTLAEVFSVEEKEQRHADKGREGFTPQDGLQGRV
jgi:transcriptional regulator with XRE-family HTH domain